MRKMLLAAALIASAACSRQSESDTGEVSPKTPSPDRAIKTADTTKTDVYQPSAGQAATDTTRMHTDTTTTRTPAVRDTLRTPGDSAMIHRAAPDSSTQTKHDSM
jgi:hypothetical protein